MVLGWYLVRFCVQMCPSRGASRVSRSTIYRALMSSCGCRSPALTFPFVCHTCRVHVPSRGARNLRRKVGYLSPRRSNERYRHRKGVLFEALQALKRLYSPGFACQIGSHTCLMDGQSRDAPYFDVVANLYRSRRSNAFSNLGKADRGLYAIELYGALAAALAGSRLPKHHPCRGRGRDVAGTAIFSLYSVQIPTLGR